MEFIILLYKTYMMVEFVKDGVGLVKKLVYIKQQSLLLVLIHLFLSKQY